MSWITRRHFVAKRVLAKHMDDLDRKQAQMDYMRRESMKDLKKDARNFGNMKRQSNPTTGSGLTTLRRRSMYDIGQRDGARSVIFPKAEHLHSQRTPPYTERIERNGNRPIDTLRVVSNRRQSDPDIVSNILHASFPARYTPNQGTNSRRNSLVMMDGNITRNNQYEPEYSTVQQLPQRDVPSYALSRRMSLPANSTGTKSKGATESRRQSFAFGSNGRPRIRSLSKRRGGFKEGSGVNVTFFDEETGEETDFDNLPTRLPAIGADSSSIEDSEEESPSKSSGSETPNGTVWNEVAKCRYIRGYDPPEMKMPDGDPGVFVFGRNLNDSIEAQILEKKQSMAALE